ncbi:uncharacterized protein ACNLHF_025509 [Anomaloglossus baeobatrachus]|uniref:uncharacterized protein LOC142245428 n=1 Tax=Anomaloglossus baeobatrachus TaxID=238106 RepID=UPI003F50CDE7
MAPWWPGTSLLSIKAPRKLVFLFTLSLSVTYLFYSLLSCYTSLQFPLQDAGLYLQPDSGLSPVDAIRTASLKPDPATSAPESGSSVSSIPRSRAVDSYLPSSTGSSTGSNGHNQGSEKSSGGVSAPLSASAVLELRASVSSASSATFPRIRTLNTVLQPEWSSEKTSSPGQPATQRPRATDFQKHQALGHLDSSGSRKTSWIIAQIPSTAVSVSTLDSTPIQTSLKFSTLDSAPIKSSQEFSSTLDSTPIKSSQEFSSTLDSTPIQTIQEFSTLDSAPIQTAQEFNTLDITPIQTSQEFNTLDITPIQTFQEFSTLDSASIQTSQEFSTLDSTPSQTSLEFSTLDSAPIQTSQEFSTLDSAPFAEAETLSIVDRVPFVRGQGLGTEGRVPFVRGQRLGIEDRVPLVRGQGISTEDGAPFLRGQGLGSEDRVPFVRRQGLSTEDRVPFVRGQGFSTEDGTNFVRGQGFNTEDRVPFVRVQGFTTEDRVPFVREQGFRTEDSTNFVRGQGFNTEDRVPFIRGQGFSTEDGAHFVRGQGLSTEDRVPFLRGQGFSSEDNAPFVRGQGFSTLESTPILSSAHGFSTLESSHNVDADISLQGSAKVDKDPKEQSLSLSTAIPGLSPTLNVFSTADTAPIHKSNQDSYMTRDPYPRILSDGELSRPSDLTGNDMHIPWDNTPLAATEMIPESHTGYFERETQESSTTEEELGRRLSVNSTIEYGDKKLPQAIIIGVKKGGTRALLEALRAHPDVRAVGVEPHFFDRNYEKGLEWYRDLMPRTVEGQITMEKTPSYFVTNEAPQRIHSMAKDTKLIMVVRNPVTRAISDYTQTLSKKPEIPTFEVLAFKNRTLGLIDASWSALRIGIYALHLESWMQYFPLSQILFVSGEHLISNPAEELAKVQDFLGLQRIITDKHFYFNKTKGFPCLKKPEDTGAPRCLGKSKGRTHPKIDPDVIQRLRKFYKPFNAMFYQMTGQDFQWEKEELDS